MCVNNVAATVLAATVRTNSACELALAANGVASWWRLSVHAV